MAKVKEADQEEIREAVRETYAGAAKEADKAGCETSCCGDQTAEASLGGVFYNAEERDAATHAVANTSLGCGNPTAVADLAEGEAVLDLGSGTGTDVLVSAKRVGPTGKVYGLDMTDEMLEVARKNADNADFKNVEWLKGYIEDIPLADETVDVVISNCVINLSADKSKVLQDSFRVLKPGGRFSVTDVLAEPDMDEKTRNDIAKWTGCVAGALTDTEFTELLEGAGFEQVEIERTHEVHDYVYSAIVRARKPSS